MKKTFYLNPFVIFSYVAICIFITMLCPHPIIVGCSFVASIVLFFCLNNKKTAIKSLAISLITIAILTIFNPIFSKVGTTILFYFNKKPITLEAVLYGLNMSCMLVASLYWFACLNNLLCSDDYVYMFGKTLPQVSLLLSMIIAMVPTYIKLSHDIDDANMGLGLYSNATRWQKLKAKLHTISAVVGIGIESAVTTADSMTSRGYGLRKRKSFSLKKWLISDSIYLAVCLSFGLLFAILLGQNLCDFIFYPQLGQLVDNKSIWLITAIAIYMSFGILFYAKEVIKWHIYQSKI